jgi:hypothetical protein
LSVSLERAVSMSTGRFAGFAHAAQDLEAAHFRQADVEHDQRGLRLLEEAQAGLAVLGNGDGVARGLEVLRHERRDLLLVLDDQDRRLHARAVCGRTPAAVNAAGRAGRPWAGAGAAT